MSNEDEKASATAPRFDQIYAEVHQFYARHMQMLDAGAADEWAAMFTADGSFAPPSLPEPVRGRASLAAGARKAAAGLAELNETHRHWLGMVAIGPWSGGSLQVRSYAQIFAIPRGGPPRLHLTCICEDELVRENGELRLRQRRVTRDDQP